MENKSGTIVVVFLGGLRDAAGQRTAQLLVEADTTVDELRQQLVAQFPPLERLMPSVRFALDSRYVDPAERVGRAAELALIPPVAGG